MNEHEVRELIRRELSNLGDAMRPNASYELAGFDPDYETNQVIVPADVSDSVADEQMRTPLHPGETVPFEFHFNISLDDANAVTGVNVQAPEPKSGSFQIDGGESHPVADFNTAVGRLSPGNHVIKGIVEADGHGYLQLLWGPSGAVTPIGTGSGTGTGKTIGDVPYFPTSHWFYPLGVSEVKNTAPDGSLSIWQTNGAGGATFCTSVIFVAVPDPSDPITTEFVGGDYLQAINGVTWTWSTSAEAAAAYLKLATGFLAGTTFDFGKTTSTGNFTHAFPGLAQTGEKQFLISIASYRAAGASATPTLSVVGHPEVIFTEVSSIELGSTLWRLSVWQSNFDWLAASGTPSLNLLYTDVQDVILYIFAETDAWGTYEVPLENSTGGATTLALA